ncbi:MAG: peptidylprolyl isomerase [Nitrososphaerales archaeon]
MANKNERVAAEETKKQAHRRRRDEEANRRAMIGLAAVGGVLLLIILAGVIQELVLKPRQPVATVNGERISLQDYQQQVKLAYYNELRQGQQIADPQQTGLQVLDQMVDMDLVREQAKQRGITVTDQEITDAIQNAFGFYRQTPTPFPTATPNLTASPTPSPTGTISPTMTPMPTPTLMTEQAFNDEFKRTLDSLKASTGISEADYRRQVELSLLEQKLYEDVTKDVPTTAEQVRLRHILIAIRTPQPTPAPTQTPAPDATAVPTVAPGSTATPTPQPTPAPRTDAEALALAIKVKQQLDAGGDFAALAREYSDDTGSKAQGGELGWYAKGGGFVQEFEDAAFSLPVGKISDPVKTQFGYHIIQVEEKDPNHPLDAYAVAQKKSEAYQKWLTDLRNAATIVRNWTADKLPPTPGAG